MTLLEFFNFSLNQLQQLQSNPSSLTTTSKQETSAYFEGAIGSIIGITQSIVEQLTQSQANNNGPSDLQIIENHAKKLSIYSKIIDNDTFVPEAKDEHIFYLLKNLYSLLQKLKSDVEHPYLNLFLNKHYPALLNFEIQLIQNISEYEQRHQLKNSSAKIHMQLAWQNEIHSQIAIFIIQINEFSKANMPGFSFPLLESKKTQNQRTQYNLAQTVITEMNSLKNYSQNYRDQITPTAIEIFQKLAFEAKEIISRHLINHNILVKTNSGNNQLFGNQQGLGLILDPFYRSFNDLVNFSQYCEAQKKNKVLLEKK